MGGQETEGRLGQWPDGGVARLELMSPHSKPAGDREAAQVGLLTA